MNDFLEKVAEFHEQFDMPILEKPTIIDSKRFEMRLGLILEEAKELQEAFEKGDKVEIGDALTDLQYVVSGMILELGYQNIFKDMFNEVHRSNMSKACEDYDEAQETIAQYQKLGQIGSGFKKNGKINIIRIDGKLLKSVNYSPAELKQFIE